MNKSERSLLRYSHTLSSRMAFLNDTKCYIKKKVAVFKNKFNLFRSLNDVEEACSREESEGQTKYEFILFKLRIYIGYFDI